MQIVNRPGEKQVSKKDVCQHITGHEKGRRVDEENIHKFN